MHSTGWTACPQEQQQQQGGHVLTVHVYYIVSITTLVSPVIHCHTVAELPMYPPSPSRRGTLWRSGAVARLAQWQSWRSGHSGRVQWAQCGTAGTVWQSGAQRGRVGTVGTVCPSGAVGHSVAQWHVPVAQWHVPVAQWGRVWRSGAVGQSVAQWRSGAKCGAVAQWDTVWRSVSSGSGAHPGYLLRQWGTVWCRGAVWRSVAQCGAVWRSVAQCGLLAAAHIRVTLWRTSGPPLCSGTSGGVTCTESLVRGYWVKLI